MIPQKYQACIDACADCIVACKDASSEDLKEDDIEMMARSIKLDHDCAAVCILANPWHQIASWWGKYVSFA